MPSGSVLSFTSTYETQRNSQNTYFILLFIFTSRFPHLQFEYTAPSPEFDHSRVKGPVAKLISLKDSTAATALEVAAGAKVR